MMVFKFASFLRLFGLVWISVASQFRRTQPKQMEKPEQHPLLAKEALPGHFPRYGRRQVNPVK